MSIRCGPPRAEASARRPLRGRTCGARQPLFGSELAKERDRAGREQRTFTRGGFGPPASARPNLRRKTPLFGSELAKERNRAGRELRAFAGRRLRPAGLCEAEPAAQDNPYSDRSLRRSATERDASSGPPPAEASARRPLRGRTCGARHPYSSRSLRRGATERDASSGPSRAEASARRPLRGRTCGARHPYSGRSLRRSATERDASCGPSRAEASARRPLRGRTCGARHPYSGRSLRRSATERDANSGPSRGEAPARRADAQFDCDPPTSARFDHGRACPARDLPLQRPPPKTTRRKPTRKKLSDPIRTAFFIHSAYSAAPPFATPVRPAAPPYSISRRLSIAWVIVSSSTYSSSSPKPMPRAIEVIRNPSKRRRRLMR